VGVGEVVAGNPAVAVYSKASGPGDTDKELVGQVIAPDRRTGTAAKVGFSVLGDGDVAAGDDVGLIKTGPTVMRSKRGA